MGWPHGHVLSVLIRGALLSVLACSSIIVLGLRLFPYMEVHCLCFGLVCEGPLGHRSGWSVHLDWAQVGLGVVLHGWDAGRMQAWQVGGNM